MTTRTLIEGSTGQKFSSEELTVQEADLSSIAAVTLIENNAAIALDSGTLSGTKTVFSIPTTTPNVTGGAGIHAGVIIDIDVRFTLTAAAAISETLLTIAPIWAGSPNLKSRVVPLQWQTVTQERQAFVRLYAESPAAAAVIQVSFTADAIPATETLTIRSSTNFWLQNINGLIVAAA